MGFMMVGKCHSHNLCEAYAFLSSQTVIYPFKANATQFPGGTKEKKDVVWEGVEISN